MPGGRFARLVMETRRARALREASVIGRCPSDICDGEVGYVDDDSTAVRCDRCDWFGFDEQIIGMPEMGGGAVVALRRHRGLERIERGMYTSVDRLWLLRKVDHQRWDVLHRRSLEAPYRLEHYEPTLREAIAYIEAPDR